MNKVFLICDDNHPDYYVGRIERKDSELIAEIQKLKIGDIYQNKNSTTHLIREAWKMNNSEFWSCILWLTVLTSLILTSNFFNELLKEIF